MPRPAQIDLITPNKVPIRSKSQATFRSETKRQI